MSSDFAALNKQFLNCFILYPVINRMLITAQLLYSRTLMFGDFEKWKKLLLSYL